MFNTHERPWIQPLNAEASEVAAAVQRCPSGALHFVSDDIAEQPHTPTTVTVRADGPVMLRGDFTVETPDGPLAETRAAICGCQKTGNAPFCDGACGCSP